MEIKLADAGAIDRFDLVSIPDLFIFIQKEWTKTTAN